MKKGHEFEGEKWFMREFGGGNGREKCNYIIISIIKNVKIFMSEWGDYIILHFFSFGHFCISVFYIKHTLLL